MPASDAELKALADVLETAADTLAYLQETGLRQVKLDPKTWAALTAPLPAAPQPALAPTPQALPRRSVAAEATVAVSQAKVRHLETMRANVVSCAACPLAAANRCFGGGSPEAPVAVVNGACMEGPAAPAVGSRLEGPAGELFDKMFAAIGLTRADLYITPALKCPVRGKPDTKAMVACQRHLVAELRTVAPKAIVVLGPVAAKTLFPNASADWMQHPGRWTMLDNRIPVTALHHPMRIMLLGDAVSRQLKTDNWKALQALRDRLKA